MTSKERVRACVNREPTDAVPLGFYLVDHDIISKVIGRPTYVRNKVAKQLALWEGRRDEVVESMKVDVVDFYKKMDLCDIITFKEACLVPPKGHAPDPPKKISDKHWEDKQGRVYMVSEISNEFICIKVPFWKKRNGLLRIFKSRSLMFHPTLPPWRFIITWLKNSKTPGTLPASPAALAPSWCCWEAWNTDS